MDKQLFSYLDLPCLLFFSLLQAVSSVLTRVKPSSVSFTFLVSAPELSLSQCSPLFQSIKEVFHGLLEKGLLEIIYWSGFLYDFYSGVASAAGKLPWGLAVQSDAFCLPPLSGQCQKRVIQSCSFSSEPDFKMLCYCNFLSWYDLLFCFWG